MLLVDLAHGKPLVRGTLHERRAAWKEKVDA